MKKKKTIVIALISVLIAFGGLLIVNTGASSPTAGSSVKVAFCGYTNDAAGTNMISFVVSNATAKKITIGNYFVMCPSDRAWDVAQDRRLVLGHGQAASLMLPKPKGLCTLLVLYNDYEWKEAVRYWAVRTKMTRLLPNSWMRIQRQFQHAELAISDDLKPNDANHPN